MEINSVGSVVDSPEVFWVTLTLFCLWFPFSDQHLEFPGFTASLRGSAELFGDTSEDRVAQYESRGTVHSLPIIINS